MKVQVGKERGAATQSVLTQHGIAHWLNASGEIGRQEMILPPSILSDKTADSIYSAIVSKHRLPITTMLGSGLFSCLQISTDAASTHARVVKWLRDQLPASQLMTWQKCLQHQAAITVGNMTLHLGFLCPMFCCAKILQQGKHITDVKREVAKVIEEKLEWTYGETPAPEDIARTKALVDDCLLHPFVDRETEKDFGAFGATCCCYLQIV